MFSLYDIIITLLYFSTKILIKLCNLHTSYERAKTKKPPVLRFNENLKVMMKLRNGALSKYKKFKTKASWNYYKKLRKLTNTAAKAEK